MLQVLRSPLCFVVKVSSACARRGNLSILRGVVGGGEGEPSGGGTRPGGPRLYIYDVNVLGFAPGS